MKKGVIISALGVIFFVTALVSMFLFGIGPFDNSISIPDIPLAVEYDSPLRISGEFSLPLGERVSLSFDYYNFGNDTIIAKPKISECISEGGNVFPGPDLVVLGQNIESGETKTFNTFITIEESSPFEINSTYLCTFSLIDEMKNAEHFAKETYITIK